jgi:hypothetical protein
MRYTPLLWYAPIVAILFAGCKKDMAIGGKPTNPLIAQAERFFNDSIVTAGSINRQNPRVTKTRRILWGQAMINDARKSVIAPIVYNQPDFIYDPATGHYYSANTITRLVMVKDNAGRFRAAVQLCLPDEAFLQNPSGKFSGTVLQENWQGYLLRPYRVVPRLPGHRGSGDMMAAADAEDIVITTCSTIYGYNYPANDPGAGYAWSSTSCDVMVVPDDQDYGGGGGATAEGGGGSGASGTGGTTSTRPAPTGKTVVVTSPENVVASLPDYMHCFTNSPGASYQVKVCVDQPNAGTRDPWGLAYPADALGGANPFDVGHAFLVLTETDGYNTTVRNIGFYPGSTIMPWSGSVPGVFNNDEMHPYNISAAFNMTATNFFNLLAYVQNSTGQSYNLSTNNCTTWVLNALSQGHIYLPSTFGYWPWGMGNDPGDLGEDIRNSNAPGIIKSTSDDIHMNSGSCQ